jgi:MIP family channel proteins
MKDSWRHFTAELIGTFALVFVGSGAIILGIGVVGVALAHGLILALMVTAFMRVSGHFNPAVTLGFLVTRRIEGMMAIIYWIAQFLGATIAAYLLKALYPASAVVATRLGGQVISTDITLLQAIGLEAIATFFLVTVIFGTAVDPDAPKVGGFAIGLTIAADILAIGGLTGASMNPARSFGPAIVMRLFEGQAAYFVGPIVGAVAAAVLYDRLFLRREPDAAFHGAVRPEIVEGTAGRDS